jgi:hypothetical protein
MVTELAKKFPDLQKPGGYCVFMNLPLVPSLNHMNSMHTLYFWTILILNFLLYLGIPSGVCLSGCPTKPSHAFLSFHALFVTFPSQPRWSVHPNNKEFVLKMLWAGIAQSV